MFQTGQKIGPYVLERTLGEGSYGVVWLAEERTGLIQRHVALKLPKDTEPDIEAIRREAEVWLRAGKHHNVVQVLHADIYDGQVAIATEYIADGSLHDRLKRDPGRTADLEFAVAMTRGILAGLQHLHSVPPKPLVHRDLKPGNVLLRGDTPLLTDFGLSRAFSSSAFTQAGGTPGYMPPEAFDDRFSPQTDVWAAGVTLYRMLKGELPFPQRELSALVGAILHKEPEPLPPTVPSALQSVIYQALMKDPDRRFASAEEMRTALDDALRAGSRVISAPATRLAPIPPLPNADPPPAFDISQAQRGLQAVHAPFQGGTLPYENRGAAPEPPPVPPSPYVPVFTAEERRRRHEAIEFGAAGKEPAGMQAGRHGKGYSESLTAVPEPPARPKSLSHRVDAFLRYVGRDTARFCGAILCAVPIWAALEWVGRFLEQRQILESLPAAFLTAGLMGVYFARLAWHRYQWQPPAKRKQSAIRFAVLGMTSFAMVPVVIVTVVIALSGAIATPPELAKNEPARPKIEPP